MNSRRSAVATRDEADDLHLTVAQRVRSRGLRYTGARRRVVEVLAASDRPLTIPEILDRDDTLAQSSAYRNLTELISVGVVHRIVSGDEFAHFELAEDLTTHHHHLVCTGCGLVSDFTVDDELEAALDAALDAAARRQGFTPEHHRLDLTGRCATCAA
ncbi:MAG: Fur family transcriptional regulator [Actinomycetes bacterium]